MSLSKNIKVKEVIVSSGADRFLPFAVTLGLFVILFGTSSSGGGFQGGVIVASGCLLVYLGHGYKAAVGAESTKPSARRCIFCWVSAAWCSAPASARTCFTSSAMWATLSPAVPSPL